MPRTDSRSPGVRWGATGSPWVSTPAISQQPSTDQPPALPHQPMSIARSLAIMVGVGGCFQRKGGLASPGHWAVGRGDGKGVFLVDRASHNSVVSLVHVRKSALVWLEKDLCSWGHFSLGLFDINEFASPYGPIRFKIFFACAPWESGPLFCALFRTFFLGIAIVPWFG